MNMSGKPMHYRGFGEYLKDKREKARLSQTEVSDSLGYTSPQFISNWERGLSKPPSDKLGGIVRLYKLDREELLDQYQLSTRHLLETILGMKGRKVVEKKTKNRKRQ
jgi:transcriptional regulator with XRE-family HTH domain